MSEQLYVKQIGDYLVKDSEVRELVEGLTTELETSNNKVAELETELETANNKITELETELADKTKLKFFTSVTGNTAVDITSISEYSEIVCVVYSDSNRLVGTTFSIPISLITSTSTSSYLEFGTYTTNAYSGSLSVEIMITSGKISLGGLYFNKSSTNTNTDGIMEVYYK